MFQTCVTLSKKFMLRIGPAVLAIDGCGGTAQHELRTVYRFVLPWGVEDAVISAFRAEHCSFLDLSIRRDVRGHLTRAMP